MATCRTNEEHWTNAYRSCSSSRRPHKKLLNNKIRFLSFYLVSFFLFLSWYICANNMYILLQRMCVNLKAISNVRLLLPTCVSQGLLFTTRQAASPISLQGSSGLSLPPYRNSGLYAIGWLYVYIFKIWCQFLER